MESENSNLLNNAQPSINDMAKVLITPIYSTDSIVLAINRFSIDRLFLLVSKKSDEEQQKAVAVIKSHYEKIIDIKEKKIELYDLVEAAHQVKEIIDDQGANDEIYLNITTGRRPQAMGVLFAGYKRTGKVKKIFYVTEDTNEIITIPKLSFDVTDAQQKILDNIENVDKISEMENEIDVSKAMIYRAIIELKNKGLIEENTDKGYKLTEAGKIAKM
jgi:CRISPR locus-related DNA-binding protein